MTDENCEPPYLLFAPLDLAKMTCDDRHLALEQLKERAVLEWRDVEKQIADIKSLPVLDYGQFERKEQRLSHLQEESWQWEMAAHSFCLVYTGWSWGYIDKAESLLSSGVIPSIKRLTDESPKPHAWKAIARQIGEAWMKEQELKTGRRPSVVSIAQHIEGELSNRAVTGQRGKLLDWETIKREALKGITGRCKNGG
jgi:hypothetical protein